MLTIIALMVMVSLFWALLVYMNCNREEKREAVAIKMAEEEYNDILREFIRFNMENRESSEFLSKWVL